MCEIKYYSNDFSVDKDYYRTMLRRSETLSKLVPKKCAVYGTLITTFGLKENEYSGVFTNVRKYGKKEFLKVHDRLREKYNFHKTQEILGQDYMEGLRILEEI
ncbi:MAG: hypothetical protein J6N21_16725 [Butyrivibrio sp.]|nr:hypothetical protein [Butyrivibrio sp.]